MDNHGSAIPASGSVSGSGLSWFAVAVGTALFYVLFQAVYNVFFHPLRSYRGPWLWAASRLPYSFAIFRGNATHKIKEFHDRYGQVVRFTPDTLSYTCGQAWSDIYALKPSGQNGNLPKDPKFYFTDGDTPSISSADDTDHRRLRRVQAHAFSEKAISLQEPYLQQYTTLFVKRLSETSAARNGVVDFAKWVNFLTTDVIGDLSFGESFGGLEKGKLHPWLEALFTTLKTFTFIREILRLPAPIIRAALACIPQRMRDHQKAAVAFGAEAARRRLAQHTDRPDFMSYMLKSDSEGLQRMSQSELEMASITFIVAGSETTATMLSGTVYLLLRNRAVLADLTKRIRSDFPSHTDLTIANLQGCKYLNNVLKEGLRLYPPAPDTLFRTTKDRAVTVAGRVVPPRTSLTMNLWAAGRDPANFHRPLDFVPDRWLEEGYRPEFGHDDHSVFKPFSVGPRDCIGKNLAWAEMRLMLAHLVWNFDLLGIEPDSQEWIERQKIYSLWEKLPLNIRITPRPDKSS
ncbi:isotrichodermin C-15 hydroxylase [Xylariaceae sp. FL0594]|nr:isotrichodermin C-15 hydroxylase [Xylariaceae sp. FL0594]